MHHAEPVRPWTRVVVVLRLLAGFALAGWRRLTTAGSLTGVGLAFGAAAGWTHGRFWGCLATMAALLLAGVLSDRGADAPSRTN